jgi:1,2-diacylglycerol 3-beta-galactosyltransferase
MKRILILMSNTGGGHRASAEALKAAFAARYGDQYRIDIIDLLMDHLPRPLNRLPRLYPFLSNRAAWAWKLIWTTGRHPRQVRRAADLVARYSTPTVRRVFAMYAPDLIVSVHPLVHEISFRALRRLGRCIPVATVVTDLASMHPLWFHPKVSLCFVAGKEAYREGLKAGLTEEQIQVSGLPIRPAFAEPQPPKAELRQKLGLHPSLPATLLIGGGDGVGPVAAIARAVATRLANKGQPLGQLVVICGRNRRLHDQLSAQRWPIPTIINGFVDNMPAWMAACDCVITKAGPGTIAEALACGLPIILSGYIPGQEEGNIPFVLDNNVGAYSEEPGEIAAIVDGWFGPATAERIQLVKNARALSRPNAAFEIVDALVTLLSSSG